MSAAPSERAGRRSVRLVAAVVALSAALNVWGIRYGLPHEFTWAPDEIIPHQVLEGTAQRYSGGWSNPYPPFHFYLMSLAHAPLLAVAGASPAGPIEPALYQRLFLAQRLLSALMAAGIVWLVARSGVELGGPSAGVVAATITALALPFVYSAKFANLDVPYCFWFALALLCFLRALREPTLRRLLGFAVASTLAIATKDQAYALFAVPWILLVGRAVRDAGGAGAARHLARGLMDRRAWAPPLVAALVFIVVQNWAFNFSGFVAHVETITGPYTDDLRLVGAGIAGQAQLLVLTARLLVFCLGVPAALLSGYGLVVALRERRADARGLALLAPVAGYHALFLAPLGFAYDRFLLPVAIVVSLYGGVGFARLWPRRGLARVTAAAALVGIVGFGLLRAIGLNLTLTHDSRYHVEAWLGDRVDRERERIAALGPLEYLPRLGGFDVKQRTELIRAVRRMDPAWVVVNADFARRTEFPRAARLYDALASGELGYARALAHRTRLAWPYRPDERVRESGLPSNLDKLNPEIVVYRKAD